MTSFAWWALMLSRDPETWAALLAGEPVDPARLDPAWLTRAKAFRLVRVDVRAIELFENWPAEAEGMAA